MICGSTLIKTIKTDSTPPIFNSNLIFKSCQNINLPKHLNIFKMRICITSKQVITTLMVLASFTYASPLSTSLPSSLTIEKNSENTVFPSFLRRSATFLTADSLGLLSVLENHAWRHGFRHRNVRVSHVKRRQFKRTSFEKVLEMF